MKLKNWQVIFIITLVSLALAILSGAINWPSQFVICGLAYFTAGLLYHRKFIISRSLYGLIVVLPFVLIYTIHALANSLIHVYPIAFWPPIAIAAGLLINRLNFHKQSKKKKSSSIILIVLIILFLGYVCFPNWLIYNYRVKGPEKFVVPEICLSTVIGEYYCLSNQKGKVVVLDFWSSGCGICFKKFPELENLHIRYSGNNNVNVFAVNLLIRKDNLDSIIHRAGNFNYSFNHLFTSYESAKEVRKLLKINGVPTLIIIDKKGDIIYRGGLNTKKHIILDNAFNIIDDALRE